MEGRVDAPAITFVNHASFVFEFENVRLVCDPWLTGTAFNQGWRLLSPSPFSGRDFDALTHVWFSHQHPDHFSPRDLRSISTGAREKISVLYQHTLDKKIVRFCHSLRFKNVHELPNCVWTSIAPHVEVMCGKWDDRDSWLAIRTPRMTLLNINDCYVRTEAQARSIARSVGKVDVLLTQFSFANWAGNPDDEARIAREASQKRDEIRLQTSVFNPRFVIPFASFVWFSHEENFYHNRHMNRVGDIAKLIEGDLQRTAIVLYPGQTWRFEEPHDWRPSAQLYAADIERILQTGPVDSSVPVTREKLHQAMKDFLRRIKRRNPALRFMPRLRTSVRCSDLGVSFGLSLDGMTQLQNNEPVDIEMSSDSLYFALRAPWGANALAVNGRYIAPAGGEWERFFRFFRAADLNDHGLAFDLKWAAAQVIKALSRKLSRPTVLQDA